MSVLGYSAVVSNCARRLSEVSHILHATFLQLGTGVGEAGLRVASEETIIRTLDLPAGRDWVWFADVNCIGLSSRLDCEGRQRAVAELQEQWRLDHLEKIAAV